ncbi:MAG: hypothetical protein IJF58_01695 [Clostridia bacterium]|nr:hypothetical protein [Clostridia bacterium]
MQCLPRCMEDWRKRIKAEVRRCTRKDTTPNGLSFFICKKGMDKPIP